MTQLTHQFSSEEAEHPVQAREQALRVLIVGGGENNVRWLWKRHLDEQGFAVDVVKGEDAAINALRMDRYNVVVLDLVFQRGSALAVSDYANFRRPGTRLIFVNSDDFMADGTIFRLCSNACALIPSHTTPSDVAAIVTYHCGGY